MADNTIIGAPLEASIVKQIQDRGAIQSRTLKGKGSHLFGQANSAWVLLRSGVDTLSTLETSNQYERKPSDVVGTPELAKSAELTGGLLNNGRQRSGISKTENSPSVRFHPSSNTVSTNNAAYTTSTHRGARPQSGITSVTVSSANTYGTLLNAQVSFVVHSLEELEVMELLYMRPGMYVLLEFGHSFYPINARSGQTRNGEFQPYGYATRENHTVSDSIWYDNRNPERIEKEILKLRQSTYHNYEAIFGPVTNFSWTLTNDGSYECSIDITSKGVILEGLKLSAASANIPTEEIAATSGTTEGTDSESDDFSNVNNIFTYITQQFSAYSGDDRFPKTEDVLNSLNQTTAATHLGGYYFPNFTYFGGYANLGFTMKTSGWGYLSLGFILKTINTFSTLFGENSQTNPIICFNTEYGQKYRTYPDHFSANPLIALLPKTSARYPNFQLNKQGTTLAADIANSADGQGDDILDIYVSLNTINQIAKAVTEREHTEPDSGQGVVDFLKGILAEITSAFGGINRFDIIAQNQSDTPGKFYIVDRAYVPETGIPVLSLTGDRSTATNLTIKSQIPTAIQNTIAIQAAAGPDSTTTSDSGMKSYLKHTINRFYRYVSNSNTQENGEKQNSQSDSEAQAQARLAVEERLTTFYSNLNASGGSASMLKPEVAKALQTDAKVVITADNKAYYSPSNNQPDTIPIPIELEIELLGIGGIAPASVFNMERELLPRIYQTNNINFIVTTINHTIDTGNVWRTQITAQLFSKDA